MARTDTQINIRLPPNMLEATRSAAKKNGRSVTAEVVDRLEDAARLLYHLEAQAKELPEEVEGNGSPQEELFAKYMVAQMQAKSLMRTLADMEDEIGNLTGLAPVRLDGIKD